MMGRVLIVEGFGAFGVTIEGGDHSGEGGEDFVGSRPGEGDVFRGDDTLGETCRGGEVVGRQSSCDFRSEGEAGDTQGS